MESETVTYFQSPVFHVGRKNKVNHFCNDDNFIICHKEDGNWLGNGMYFWDNEYDANYWFCNLKKKYPDELYLCTKGNLKVPEDQMLNLTNKKDMDQFSKELEHLCSLFKREVKNSLGANINLYYKLYEEFSGYKPFIVSKIFAQYANIPVNELIYKPSMGPKITTNIRTIYSVLEASAIHNRILVSL